MQYLGHSKMLTCLLNKRREDQDWREDKKKLSITLLEFVFFILEQGMHRDFLVLRYEYTRSLRLLFKLYNQPSKWASLCLWVRRLERHSRGLVKLQPPVYQYACGEFSCSYGIWLILTPMQYICSGWRCATCTTSWEVRCTIHTPW